MKFDRSLKNKFKEVSELYDASRPSYPEKLINDIIKISDVDETSKALDVGCGPATATRLFVTKGVAVLGIDIGEELIELAKEKTRYYENCSFQVSSFEDVELEEKSLDLIYSAQAWHWIDPEIAYKKAHSLLKDKGYLALFWKFEDFDYCNLIQELTELFVKYCNKKNKRPLSIVTAEQYLESSDLFDKYSKFVYRVDIEFSKDRFRNMVHTFSWVINLKGENKDLFEQAFSKLLETQEESFTLPYVYTLLIARKRD